MSAVHPALLGAENREGRPGYWRVLRGVFWGQLVGSLALYAICLVLTVLAIAGVKFDSVSLYRPWPIDGAWALSAAIGWGTLVSALIGSAVRSGVQWRTDARLSRGWCALSVAIGGYGSMLISGTSGGRFVLAVALTPALVLALAFERSGAPRPFPWSPRLSRRRLGVACALIALVLVAPYGVLHPFVANGSEMSGPPTSVASSENQSGGVTETYAVGPGRQVQAGVGLGGGRVAVSVTGARLLGDLGGVRTVRIAFAPGDPARALTATAARPLHVAAGRSLWITYTVALTRCPAVAASVQRVRVYYRVLGVALSQTVALQNVTALTCRQPGLD